MIKFTATMEERDIIAKIAERAERVLLREYKDRFTTMMDLEVVHSNSPLRLADFLAADDFNFIHDIVGIRRHLNRETGNLEDCFLPRFTA